MKKLNSLLILLVVLSLSPNKVNAQLWKRIQSHVERTITNEAENRIEKRADKGINSAYDEVENGIDGKDSNKSQEVNTSYKTNNNSGYSSNNTSTRSVAHSSNSSFNNSNLSSIKNDKFSKEPYNYAFITISDKNGNIVPSDSDVYIYMTSDGNYGKLQITSVDKQNNYRTTFRYVTYNSDGSIKSQSDNFAVRGTYSFDLDEGIEEGVDRNDADFFLDRKDDNLTELVGDQDGIMIKKHKNSGSNSSSTSKPKMVWSKFDFVPGDEVIFEDGPSVDEENGEFPSRWDLYKGNAEIAEVDGENVIIFPEGGDLVPYLKNSSEDYLPEVFTIEFDGYFNGENPHRFWIEFYDKKNQRIPNGHQTLTFYHDEIAIASSDKNYSKELPKGGWRHFSVAVTKDKIKAYLNDERLINIPHMGFNPTGITMRCDGYAADTEHQYIKNFRLAKGGVKYYDKVMTDGKIIVNGIRFDVNKASIKPESMGAINKIYKLMKKKPELNFSVEGHTDSDGDNARNMELSKQRGKSVMDMLISMGISSDRLKYNGFGESKPLTSNSSPEGKANNRRVEFVKF